MISYLKGIVAGVQTGSPNRWILTLEVNGIGYDVYIPQRLANQLTNNGDVAHIFTHYQIREELPILYGFSSPAERDLFRHLLSVTGIGTAMAIALIDTLELPQLVQAIISGNTTMLVQTPGVGKKTAERLCLELKGKLVEWRKSAGFFVATGGPPPAILEEVQMTLFAWVILLTKLVMLSTLSVKISVCLKMPTLRTGLNRRSLILVAMKL